MTEEQQQPKPKKRLALLSKKAEKVNSIDELKKKIVRIFKSHIGYENRINPYELFTEVFNLNPMEMDIYERNYYWNALRRVMASMRTTNECFIVHRGFSFFVLKAEDELNNFIKSTNRHIKTLRLHKKNARVWVRGELWKNI